MPGSTIRALVLLLAVPLLSGFTYYAGYHNDRAAWEDDAGPGVRVESFDDVPPAVRPAGLPDRGEWSYEGIDGVTFVTNLPLDFGAEDTGFEMFARSFGISETYDYYFLMVFDGPISALWIEYEDVTYNEPGRLDFYTQFASGYGYDDEGYMMLLSPQARRELPDVGVNGVGFVLDVPAGVLMLEATVAGVFIDELRWAPVPEPSAGLLLGLGLVLLRAARRA